jgi:putative tricarboxylic transport membrane protein
MPAFVRNPKDFWTGLIFIAFGIAFLLIAQGYPLGSARRMGPAYFPTMLSVVLILIGIAATVRSFIGHGTAVGQFALKPMALIAIGTILFGVLVRDAGVVAAVLALVVVTAYSSIHFSWRAASLLGIGLAVFCVGIFVYGLGLSIPIVGPLLGGG